MYNMHSCLTKPDIEEIRKTKTKNLIRDDGG